MSIPDEDKGKWNIEQLPKSWEWVEFKDLLYDRTSAHKKIPQKDYLPIGKIPIIDQGESFIGGYTDDDSLTYDGDLPVIVWGDHTRVIKLVSSTFVQGADGVKILQPNRSIDVLYAYYAMRSIELPNKGYSRHFKFLKASSFPLSPINEQRRIVAKLDSLLAHSRRTREELEHIPKLVKRYKQAVLAAAFRGDLTADWRDKNLGIETASALLAKTLENRRYLAENLEKQIRKSKYKEPIEFTGEIPFEIPETWFWVSADQISSQITDGEHIQPPYQTEGLPMLSAKHVRDGYVEMSDLKFISEDDFEKAALRCFPKNGDVLIVSVGATTGRAAIVSDCQPFVIVRSVLLLKPLIDPKFIYYWIGSPFCQDWISKASGASAQPHFYINDNKRMPVPIPPEKELQEIVRRVEKMFKSIESIEEQYQQARQLCDRLEQATLAKAFRGELVPQDPNDEPASVLLERICAEKQQPVVSTGKKSRRKTA